MENVVWQPWLVLLLLGAGHGVNPGMGWLFAVALGMQERRGAAVWRSLAPLAAGHALAVAAAVGVALGLGVVIPPRALKYLVAASLVVFGLLHGFRARHPRFGGMQVGSRDLALWSCLMASAHGAGLMVVPVVLAGPGLATGVHQHHAGPMVQQASLVHEGLWQALAATGIHTAGYLLITGLVATLVYYRFGLRMLRTAWINLDLVWAAALVVTGGVVLLV